MTLKEVHIFGGGTVSHIRPHLALSAPAYGGTARELNRLCKEAWKQSPIMHLTKMAGVPFGSLETNEDVAAAVDKMVELAPQGTIVFFSVAMVDFKIGSIGIYGPIRSDPADKKYVCEKAGKDEPRLKSHGIVDLHLEPAEKIISRIRKTRKDIFLVGLKTTTSATEDEQYLAGLDLLKRASCNLVLANDVHTRTNMIITPEQARYHITKDREEVLTNLVEMTKLRSSLHFTRSSVIKGDLVKWSSDSIPDSLREVVNHCISRGAYKPFRGSTVGHFAVRYGENEFLTSIRKTNFNKLDETGLVRVSVVDGTKVIAHGAKPSVGGQSQRIVFAEHPDTDCIVHFHCPKKADSAVPVRSQREYECGSHECGKNTSDGLKKFSSESGPFEEIHAVMLDKHGPNIVFNSRIDPKRVIDFIEKHFDLPGRTDDVQNVPAEYAQA